MSRRTVLASLLATPLLGAAARWDDAPPHPPRRRLPRAPDLTHETKPHRLRRLRAVTGLRDFSDNTLALYARAGCTATTLEDAVEIDCSDPERPRWVHKDRERLAGELERCRSHGVSVVVTIPMNDAYLHDLTPESSETVRAPLLFSSAASQRAAASAAAAPAQGTGDPVLVPGVTREVLAQRAALWAELDRGEILGAMLVGDDICLLRIPREDQFDWRQIVRAVAPGIPIFGCAGEFLLASPQEVVRACWDVRTADHWAILNYPYSLSGFWTAPLNHELSSDPDGDALDYQRRYAQRLTAAFAGATPETTAPASQVLLFVSQAFYYPQHGTGTLPRIGPVAPDAGWEPDALAGNDLAITGRYGHRMLAELLGQRHASVSYFYVGGIPNTALGVIDIPGYVDAVIAELDWAKRLVLTLP